MAQGHSVATKETDTVWSAMIDRFSHAFDLSGAQAITLPTNDSSYSAHT